MLPSSARRHRHRASPTIEAVEPRALLSVAPMLYAAQASAASRAAASLAQPTPHERARQAFSASFAGRTVIGRGRYTDQAFQAFFVGPMTSSAFLHGDLAMSLFVPKDPTQPVTGQAALIVRNVSNSGNLLILDLAGAPPATVTGKPTRLTWTVSDQSGGTFSGAEGQGTVTIRYRGLGPRHAVVFGQGASSVVFRGAINTSGLTDVLRF